MAVRSICIVLHVNLLIMNGFIKFVDCICASSCNNSSIRAEQRKIYCMYSQHFKRVFIHPGWAVFSCYRHATARVLWATLPLLFPVLRPISIIILASYETTTLWRCRSQNGRKVLALNHSRDSRDSTLSTVLNHSLSRPDSRHQTQFVTVENRPQKFIQTLFQRGCR